MTHGLPAPLGGRADGGRDAGGSPLGRRGPGPDRNPRGIVVEEVGSRDEPRAALRSLASGRLRFVFFKRGAGGGILYDAREDRLLDWAPRAAAVVDPTGAQVVDLEALMVEPINGILVAPVVAALRKEFTEGWTSIAQPCEQLNLGGVPCLHHEGPSRP